MEIKIRNIDPTAVRKLDELAKAKKMSREKYLRELLETFSLTEFLKNQNRQYEELVKISLAQFRKNDELLARIEQAIFE